MENWMEESITILFFSITWKTIKTFSCIEIKIIDNRNEFVVSQRERSSLFVFVCQRETIDSNFQRELNLFHQRWFSIVQSTSSFPFESATQLFHLIRNEICLLDKSGGSDRVGVFKQSVLSSLDNWTRRWMLICERAVPPVSDDLICQWEKFSDWSDHGTPTTNCIEINQFANVCLSFELKRRKERLLQSEQRWVTRLCSVQVFLFKRFAARKIRVERFVLCVERVDSFDGWIASPVNSSILSEGQEKSPDFLHSLSSRAERQLKLTA